VTRTGFDPAHDALPEQPALVYAPRRGRQRFPATCVTPVASEHDALAGADPQQQLHPARVRGPCISSEGVRIYYLVCWLG
jgi:hypothetical protein